MVIVVVVEVDEEEEEEEVVMRMVSGEMKVYSCLYCIMHCHGQ